MGACAGREILPIGVIFFFFGKKNGCR